MNELSPMIKKFLVDNKEKLVRQFSDKLGKIRSDLDNSTTSEQIIEIAKEIQDLINLEKPKFNNYVTPNITHSDGKNFPTRAYRVNYRNIKINLGLIILMASSIKAGMPIRTNRTNRNNSIRRSKNSIDRFKALVDEMNKICDSLIALNTKINTYQQWKSIINSYLRLKKSGFPLWNIVKSNVTVTSEDFIPSDEQARNLLKISKAILTKFIDVLQKTIDERYFTISGSNSTLNSLPDLRNVKINKFQELNGRLQRIQYGIEWEPGNNGILIPYAVKLSNREST